MQVTELFASGLTEAIKHHKHGNIEDFVPSSHTSMPDIQENLLYVCASGSFAIHAGDELSFQDVRGFMLLLTESGHGTIDITGDVRKAAPQTLLLWDCRDYIRLFAASEEWRGKTVFFDGNASEVFYEEICKLNFPIFDAPISSSYDCCLREILSSGTIVSPQRALTENKLLTDMLTSIIFSLCDETISDFSVPENIVKIRRALDSRFNEDISFDQLAKQFGINRYRLSRDFSHYFGMPPIKYLTKVRIEQAQLLLESTELSVGKVGTAVGMDNATHFIKTFRSWTGMTPQKYREKYMSLR